MLDGLLWLSFGFCAGGYYFINRKNVIGYYLFLTGNLLTIAFDIITSNIPQMLMFVMFVLFNIDGIRRWTAMGKCNMDSGKE